MHLISSFLFAVSANIDSFIVGMTYGIKKSDITLLKSTIISLVTLTGTVIAILMGSEISRFFPTTTTAVIGSSLLIGLGMYYVLKTCFSLLRQKIHKPQIKSNQLISSAASTSKTSLLTIKEGLLLGLTLSVNNFGMGIGASLTGLRLVPTAVASLLVSVVFLYAGNVIGKTKIPALTDRTADLLSGLILVLLGIYEYFR